MSDAQPVVSVCCIAYNQSAFIRQALDGFLIQQTSFPFEIIVHDDRSTDGTAEIIADYQRNHPDKIRAIFQSENQYAKGKKIFPITFEAARGRYLALCEGDDYWTDPHKLQAQVDYLEAHPAYSACFTNAEFFYEDGSQGPHLALTPGQKEIITLEDILAVNMIPTCTVMFRKWPIAEYPAWFNQIKVADWGYHILNAQQGDIGYLDRVTTVRRVHAGGIFGGASKINRLKMVLEAKEVVNAHFEYRYNKILGAGIFSHAYQLAHAYERQHDRASAKKYLRKCFRHIWQRQQVKMAALIKLAIKVYAPLAGRLGSAVKNARRPAR